MDAASGRPRYLIGAARHANYRLDHQFHLIQASFNNQLLDPHIRYAQIPNLKVADVCCGTGIWLLSLISSNALHPTTELHALDINLSNLPPKPWISGIVQHTYNVFDEPPPALWNNFDIVNVSLTSIFVNDKFIDSVLSNILKMVKPGGWLQWTEFDIEKIPVFFPNPTLSAEVVGELESICPGVLELFGSQPSTWISCLERLYVENEIGSIRNNGGVKPLIDQSAIKDLMEQLHGPGADEQVVKSVSSMLQDTPENRRKLKNIKDVFVRAYHAKPEQAPKTYALFDDPYGLHGTRPAIWTANVDSIFNSPEHNLKEVNVTRPMPDFQRLKSWSNSYYFSYEEIIASFLRLRGETPENLEKAKQYSELMEAAYQEFQETGACPWLPLVRAIGRKSQSG